MQDRTDKHNKKGGYLEWTKQRKAANESDDLDRRDNSSTEEIIQHTPTRKQEKRWAYTLTDGGTKYFVELPNTPDQVAKVKSQLSHPPNWRFYHRNPYGGHRAYTQITCFPPFDILRVSEVFFPDGTVWSSITRRFNVPSKNENVERTK